MTFCINAWQLLLPVPLWHILRSHRKLSWISKLRRKWMWRGMATSVGIWLSLWIYCTSNTPMHMPTAITALLFALVIFGSTAIILLMEFCPWRKTIKGYCPKCDYDLRGTIAAGRKECPECGEEIR